MSPSMIIIERAKVYLRKWLYGQGVVEVQHFDDLFPLRPLPGQQLVLAAQLLRHEHGNVPRLRHRLALYKSSSSSELGTDVLVDLKD